MDFVWSLERGKSGEEEVCSGILGFLIAGMVCAMRWVISMELHCKITSKLSRISLEVKAHLDRTSS